MPGHSSRIAVDSQRLIPGASAWAGHEAPPPQDGMICVALRCRIPPTPTEPNRHGVGQPVSCRLQRDRESGVTDPGGAGTLLLGRTEGRGDPDDRRQVQHFPLPRVEISGA
jgi:hypothetical protein